MQDLDFVPTERDLERDLERDIERDLDRGIESIKDPSIRRALQKLGDDPIEHLSHEMYGISDVGGIDMNASALYTENKELKALNKELTLANEELISKNTLLEGLAQKDSLRVQFLRLLCEI
jgi:hypothetical protein